MLSGCKEPVSALKKPKNPTKQFQKTHNLAPKPQTQQSAECFSPEMDECKYHPMTLPTTESISTLCVSVDIFSL